MLSVWQVAKLGTASTSTGNGKKLVGYASFVKKEYRPYDAALNSMFTSIEAGVFWVREHCNMWSIRLSSDASMGIPWMGSGAVGKATFILVREVSIKVVMAFKRSVKFVFGKQDCQLEGGVTIRRKLSRDLDKRYS